MAYLARVRVRVRVRDRVRLRLRRRVGLRVRVLQSGHGVPREARVEALAIPSLFYRYREAADGDVDAAAVADHDA